MYGELIATVVGRNLTGAANRGPRARSVLHCKSLDFNELIENPLLSGIVGIDVAHPGSGPERRLRK
jgi:hypothetical protein